MLLEIDPKSTALVMIDAQAWTLGLPLAPRSAPELLANASALASRLRALGGTVILTRAAFSEGYVDMIRTPVDLELKVPEGGIPDAGLAFATEMLEAGHDLVITKRQWSAFYGTELDLQLRRRGVTSVLVAGVMTNFGVESTARDAWQHNYRTIVVEDACASLAADMHAFAIEKILPRVAQVRNALDVLSALSRPSSPPEAI